MPSVDAKTVTRMAILMAVIFLLIYDFFAVYRFGFEGTISTVVYSMSKEYPVVSFMTGLVCGHLFWGQEQGAKSENSKLDNDKQDK